MRFAGGIGLKDDLMQRHLGLSSLLLKSYGRSRFRTDWVAFRVHPAAGEDDSFRLDDFAVNVLRPVVFAFRRLHMDSAGAARAEVHLQNGADVASWAPPMNQMFGVGPGLEDDAARRVEGARNYEHP